MCVFLNIPIKNLKSIHLELSQGKKARIKLKTKPENKKHNNYYNDSKRREKITEKRKKNRK